MNGMGWHILFRYFLGFCHEAILYPALEPKSLDLWIPNPKSKYIQNIWNNLLVFNSILLRVLVVKSAKARGQ